MPEPYPPTSFPDVAEVVSLRTKGELPVVVGGHAVNIRALTYASRLGTRSLSFEEKWERIEELRV